MMFPDIFAKNNFTQEKCIHRDNFALPVVTKKAAAVFVETAVTPERKVEKLFPRWEINRHAKG